MKTKIMAAFLVIAGLVCLMVPIHGAQSQDEFSGSVTINGLPAPVNTLVEARGNGIATGKPGNPVLVTQTGLYQGLVAQGVSGSDLTGVTIRFFVNGVDTGQIATFASGVQNPPLNLNAVFTTGNIASVAAVASSLTPVVYGQPITLTATIRPSAPSGDTPTGLVSFKDGSVLVGTASLSGGQATYNGAAVGGGSHVITAAYVGDSKFAPCVSPLLVQTITPAATTGVVVSSGSPSSVGQLVTFTATLVALSPSTATPAGVISFNDGSVVLGTAALNNAGRASLPIQNLTAGPHTITAYFAGNANFSACAPILTQVVNVVNSGGGGQNATTTPTPIVTTTLTPLPTQTGTPGATPTTTPGATTTALPSNTTTPTKPAATTGSAPTTSPPPSSTAITSKPATTTIQTATSNPSTGRFGQRPLRRIIIGVVILLVIAAVILYFAWWRRRAKKQ